MMDTSRHPWTAPALRRLSRALALLVLCTCAAQTQAQDMVVIANKDNPGQLDQTYIRQLYTGAVRGWPDGSPVLVLDLPEGSPERELFATAIVGRSSANLRAIWAQNIFTGRGLPPKVLANEAEVKRMVATHRHAIGYVRASQVDASVRVLLP